MSCNSHRHSGLTLGSGQDNSVLGGEKCVQGITMCGRGIGFDSEVLKRHRLSLGPTLGYHVGYRQDTSVLGGKKCVQGVTMCGRGIGFHFRASVCARDPYLGP